MGVRIMTYDLILYYGEYDILSLRLKEHSAFVDKFIVCHINTDFTGQPRQIPDNVRPLTYFYDITEVTATMPGEPMSSEQRAKIWRNKFHDALTQLGAKDTDTIICTDLDEILSAEKWNYNPSMGLMAFEMNLYYYYMNLCAGRWVNGFVAPYSEVKGRDITDLRYNFKRRKWHTGLINDAGWHFAWLGGVDVILDKYRNFGKSEGWPSWLSDRERVEKMLKDRIVFHNGQVLDIVPINDSYPKDVRKNINRYLKYVYEYQG